MMTWENISGNAVSEENLLEMAKEEVRARIAATQKRHRAIAAEAAPWALQMPSTATRPILWRS